MQARMTYDYSTKNFHRFVDPSGTPRELYIPRAEMPKPILSIAVQVSVLDGQPVPEKAKPAKS